MTAEWTPNTPGLIRAVRAEIKDTREPDPPLTQATQHRTPPPDQYRTHTSYQESA